jgi:hypothetical protein
MATAIQTARYFGVSEGVAAAIEESNDTPLALARRYGLSEWAVTGIQDMLNPAGVPQAPTVVVLIGSSNNTGEASASCTPPIGTIFSYEWLFRESGGEEQTFVGATSNLGTVVVGLGAWTVEVRAKNVSGWSDWTDPSDQAFVTAS